MKTSKLLLQAAITAAVSVPALSSAAGLAHQDRGMVANNVPAIVAKSHLVGRHNPAGNLSLIVSLKLHNTDQLESFLRDVQDPYSPNYHHFLTPQTFTEQYGPTRDEVAAVSEFLSRNGIRVTDVSENRMLIHAQGQVAAVERAMGVTINDYSYGVRRFFAASSNPRLPTEIASSVRSVMGLSNSDVMRPHLVMSPNGKPGGGGTPAGFSPNQIATAYNWPSVTSTANGAGVKIAVATAFTYKSSDLTSFWSQYGLPSHSVTAIAVDGTTRKTDVETTLDIQRSAAMAPGAAILVYEAANAQLTTFTDCYNKVVTDNQADVMTTSWGLDENSTPVSSMQADDAIFAQASAQGIALFAAAGDNGASDGTSDSDNADFPASDPHVTAAGGTHLVLASNGSISSETVWSGSGGADSVQFGQQSWQAVRNVPQNGHRVSSDLSMDADPNTGYSVLSGGRWAVYGGTSFVAPELAGLFAVRVGQVGRLGQVNALIYANAGTSNYSTDFHDITSGSNGFSAAAFWDYPTGWGTPNASSLISHIN